MDRIWPTFIAAPRMVASWSATRRALAGVINMSLALGRLPARNLRVLSASMPPATPPAMRATRAKRPAREVGMDLCPSSPSFFLLPAMLSPLPPINVHHHHLMGVKFRTQSGYETKYAAKLASDQCKVT